MLLKKKSVELLAPVGQWDTLEAAVEAGADAVYLGGKAFNMRMFRDNFNFDNEAMAKAVEYCHSHSVNLYVTLNNLIQEDELPQLIDYLQCLAHDIKPDALIVQDLAVLELIKKLDLNLNMHASIMMNTHNEAMIKRLQEYGVSRVVTSREMSMEQISKFKEKTGIELEYFVHGDMCISEGGQCLHSGVVFGNSGSRGRCMKACRWQYKFAEEKDINNAEVMASKESLYKLALKDLCMYRILPQLIQAGIYSFKIEGRMRDAEFVSHIVGIYRRAIDHYIADPTGYNVDKEDWNKLTSSKVRGFTTYFAVDKPGYKDMGLSGKHEPRFFSKAVSESSEKIPKQSLSAKGTSKKSALAVRCATLAHLRVACANGADRVYIGGDVYRPLRPWTFADIEKAKEITAENNCKLIIDTPRITRRRELGELEQLFSNLSTVAPDGIMVHNLGSLALAKQMTNLSLYCSSAFDLFNSKAAELLQDEGAAQATASLELPYKEVCKLIENSPLPIEVIVHGSIEAMVCDFDFIAQETGKSQLSAPETFDKHYAFVDTVGQAHPLRRTQYDINYILFAHDLCLLAYLQGLNATSFCIAAQDYTVEYTGKLVCIYRQLLDNPRQADLAKVFAQIEKGAPRAVGNGVYRYNSIK